MDPEGQALTPMPPRIIPLGTGRKKFKWIDYHAPSPEQIDALGQEYDFHPLTLEDAKTFDQRAKIQDYGKYLFLSLHALQRENGTLHDFEIEAFLGQDYLITVEREPLPLLDRVRRRFQSDDARAELGPDYLLYVILDEIVESIFPIVDTVDEEIDRLEDETIERATPETLQRIFRLKQDLIEMRRSIAPMREVVNALASTRYGFVDQQTAIYFRDVYDHLARIYELIETERDLLGSALDTYLSVVSNRLNDVMKRLTIIATIFLPISFIVGFGGMNFQQVPFDNSALFGLVMSSLILVPALMLVYFWRKGWM